jgi:hypothetical protein
LKEGESIIEEVKENCRKKEKERPEDEPIPVTPGEEPPAPIEDPPSPAEKALIDEGPKGPKKIVGGGAPEEG